MDFHDIYQSLVEGTIMQIDRDSPLWSAASYLLAQRAENFFQQLDNTLKTFQLDSIHDLRVASRRLREGLALFAPCYPPKNIDKLSQRVKDVTRLLGKIRNDDEAILFFSGLKLEVSPSHKGDLEMIITAFQSNREMELDKLESGLKATASRSTRELFNRVIAGPSLFCGEEKGFDPFVPLIGFAGPAINDRLEQVIKILPDARVPGNLESQHQLRIAVKHLRYRIEILSSLLGSYYEEVHSLLKSYQDLLGSMHDMDVFTEIVRCFSFSLYDTELLIAIIQNKRKGLFDDFSSLLESESFEIVRDRMRFIC
jgi:CHAD domain-containing protein